MLTLWGCGVVPEGLRCFESRDVEGSFMGVKEGVQGGWRKNKCVRGGDSSKVFMVLMGMMSWFCE